MSVSPNEVLVFKTDIKFKKDIQKIAPALTIAGITQWTIDRDDVDCVLRVVTDSFSVNDIIEIVSDNGYTCSEL
ncbi:hypothetical protein ACQ33O_07220 [Ferruginibacter sp. SUN002]|uniref:hypothetical protein n=1 Tax=Ferruginibacter sp. SUN002 TaxID=2937789 RepID=UPI003D368394